MISKQPPVVKRTSFDNWWLYAYHQLLTDDRCHVWCHWSSSPVCVSVCLSVCVIWSLGVCHTVSAISLLWQPSHAAHPLPPLDNVWVMMIVWRFRGNIIRTALCWIVRHNVHSQQHTYMSSSYRSNRLSLSHWDPYTVCRGGCLELYYCNMVEWFWCDSSLIFDDQLVSFSALTLLVWSSCP